MGARVSMADVAARAGVSGQTVSRVVNGSPRVDPATRARIEAAMAELGYRPHRAARALRTGRTGTIGVVVATLATAGNSLMLQAVTEAAAAHRHDVAVALAGADDTVADAVARLRDQSVDGVIIVNEAAALTDPATLAEDLRIVVVDAPVHPRHLVVQTDHAGGAAEATRHLVDLGHRRIAHLAGPAGSFAAAERERGWRAALADAGLPATEPARGRWAAASGYAAVHTLLERTPRPTALVVANDQMALGVLRALAERGLRVPEDVSVVGFDDVADAADYSPPLTTVRQHFDRLGAAAVAVLLDGGPSDAAAHGRTVVPPTLVVRASTGPAPD